MHAIVLLVLGILGGTVHLYLSKQGLTARRAAHILLLYILPTAVGLNGLIGFAGHAFIPDEIAESIGWPKGNPFQFEIAVANLSYGLLGVLCLWFHGSFWVATGIGSSIFLLGAAYGHITEIVNKGNLAPNNAGAILYADIFIPVIVLSLLLARKWGNQEIV